MTFDWYKIINRDEFEATGLVSRELSLVLEGIGQVNITVTKGNVYSLIYNGVMVSVGITADNPFIFDGYASFIDPDSNIWLGVLIDES